jgi:glycosyltransferase involved in cell wall biosynthesis
VDKSNHAGQPLGGSPKRVCLVYDCLFPHTVGGAERWYRNLAERLVAGGHEVTYLTLRQWPRGADPGLRRVDVRAVGPRMSLYAAPGRRRILPPIVFGLGVLWHLVRYGRRYDVVHTASFPYFSLLGAALVRSLWRFRLVVDWHEVWTRDYWREYLGGPAGYLGWLVQSLCARVPQCAFSFSRLHADRLREEGLRGEIITLPGEYAGRLDVRPAREVEPIVLFAGRHIPEKRVLAIPPAIALARKTVPQLQAVILGDGPERRQLVQRVAELELGDAIEVPGFVAPDTVDKLMGSALCVVLPSRREGYGMVVIEAAARGTPSIVVADPDNAAVELMADGVNGFVAASASDRDLAAAILQVCSGGATLRSSTAGWFAGNARRLSVGHSLEIILTTYDSGLRLQLENSRRTRPTTLTSLRLRLRRNRRSRGNHDDSGLIGWTHAR